MSDQTDMPMDEVVEDQAEQEECEIETAFTLALNAETDEDGIKLAMISAGATFKSVTRLYNQYMIDAGLAISPADRKQIVEDTLAGIEISTEEGFDAAAKALTEAVAGATERSAEALVRSYAKKNEVEVFAKPKSEGGTRNPFVNNFHAALIENPNLDEQGLRDLINVLPAEQQTNPTRWFSQHNNIRKTVNAVAERLAA